MISLFFGTYGYRSWNISQKRSIEVFHESTWVLIEMEGSYYQKAIQSASKIRKVFHDVKVRYAYYASDNPLETGSTLIGGLGTTGKTDVFDYHKKYWNRF
jgi:uncharacterized membrane protein